MHESLIFFVYLFGKRRSERKKNNPRFGIEFAQLLSNFKYFFVLFSPGSNRSKLQAMQADVSYATVCCVHCNSSRSNQNLGSTFTTSASCVVFSRLMNVQKTSKFFPFTCFLKGTYSIFTIMYFMPTI